MSQKWTDSEHAIHTDEIEPGDVGEGRFTISPALKRSAGSPRPFRVTSIVAAAEEDSKHFRLIQCAAGKKSLLKSENGVSFPVTSIYGTVDVGGTIVVYVENVSTEKRRFAGRLVGQELVE